MIHLISIGPTDQRTVGAGQKAGPATAWPAAAHRQGQMALSGRRRAVDLGPGRTHGRSGSESGGRTVRCRGNATADGGDPALVGPTRPALGPPRLRRRLGPAAVLPFRLLEGGQGGQLEESGTSGRCRARAKGRPGSHSKARPAARWNRAALATDTNPSPATPGWLWPKQSMGRGSGSEAVDCRRAPQPL